MRQIGRGRNKKWLKLAEQLIIDLNDISLISLESINLNKSHFEY